jgi:hypothetical protein
MVYVKQRFIVSPPSWQTSYYYHWLHYGSILITFGNHLVFISAKWASIYYVYFICILNICAFVTAQFCCKISLQCNVLKKRRSRYKNLSLRFITVFTRACYSSPSWARCSQSTHFHPISLRYILISSHLCLGLPSGLFLLGFPTVHEM